MRKKRWTERRVLRRAYLIAILPIVPFYALCLGLVELMPNWLSSWRHPR